MDHLTVFSKTTPPRKRPRPSLKPIFTRLRYPLAPFYPLPEGLPHPSFPKTLLSYHLLTEDQLDSLAHYYHQVPRPGSPTIWLYGYPTCMNWDSEFLKHIEETQGHEACVYIKKRKFGRFIGLKGCETPVGELEELDKWLRKKQDIMLKVDDGGFWGRKGWGKW